MGTIPTRAAFVAGTVLTAAQMNEMLEVDEFWALTPRCSAYQSAVQSLASGTGTAVTFGAEVYDIVQSGDSPSHDNTTNNSRVYARTSGKYEICSQVQFASNATGTRSADIRLNAAGNPASGTRVALNQQAPLSGASTSVGTIPVEIEMTAGDYVEVFATQSSGGALNTVAGSGITFLRIKLTGS